MFENQPFEQSVMITRPDSNTAEAITYGDEYTFIKSATWWWDALEDELNRQLKEESLKSRRTCSSSERSSSAEPRLGT